MCLSTADRTRNISYITWHLVIIGYGHSTWYEKQRLDEISSGIAYIIIVSEYGYVSSTCLLNWEISW